MHFDGKERAQPQRCLQIIENIYVQVLLCAFCEEVQRAHAIYYYRIYDKLNGSLGCYSEMDCFTYASACNMT